MPLRNGIGQPTGATIYGATTIELTPEQRELAAQSSKLWIQGGTQANPITDAETYAFGALRCATDNLNGDNVEWISYPPNSTHVFCFAYYVKPAPTSGTITVRKEVTLPPDTPAQKLHFTGNISYANNEFFLTAANDKPDSISFIRAGGSVWNFTEQIPDLATLTAIDCTSQLGSVVEQQHHDRSHLRGAEAGRRRGLHVQEHVPAPAVRPDAAQGQHRRHRHASTSTSRARAPWSTTRSPRPRSPGSRRSSSRPTRSPTSRSAPTR